MRATIELNGKSYPVDYSVMTALEIAERYDTDVTGLQQLIAGFSQREQFEFMIQLAVIALNDGARREGLSCRYNEYDVRDLFTEDLSLASRMFEEFFSTLAPEQVFPKPSPATAKKKRTAREAADE